MTISHARSTWRAAPTAWGRPRNFNLRSVSVGITGARGPGAPHTTKSGELYKKSSDGSPELSPDGQGTGLVRA